MKIFRSRDALPVATDARSFTGRVDSKRLASHDTAVAVNVYRVAFEPGARTHWHTHTGPQWLFVLDGCVRVQKWGAPPHDVSAGDCVAIDAGEKHWHGAAAGSRGVHLAVNVNATTEWLEPVDDDLVSAVAEPPPA